MPLTLTEICWHHANVERGETPLACCFLCSKAGAIGHAHRQQHLLGDRVHDRRAHSVAELAVDVPLAKGVLARALACMRLRPRERLWEPHEPGALARREEAW